MNSSLQMTKPARIYKPGDKVKTRGDMGSIRMTVVEVHNEWFCKCRHGKTLRHFNMAYLEPIEPNTNNGETAAEGK